jgi:3-oxoacyl-(acyl-carrier-protein) reductase
MSLPMLPLTDRTALVTGASRGIGSAIAVALAEAGANVAINYRSHEDGARGLARHILTLGRRALVSHADVADNAQVKQMVSDIVDEFGHLDILVNNAGITADRSFAKMDDAQWHCVIATNLHGAFYCTKAVIQHMLDRRFGRIVNITSVVGQIGNFGQTNYAASKAALAGFTKSLAKEVASRGITVNAVAPGFIHTDMAAVIPESIQERLLGQIPLGRFGCPEEVARAVVYLASPGAEYITGTELCINGGFLCN